MLRNLTSYDKFYVENFTVMTPNHVNIIVCINFCNYENIYFQIYGMQVSEFLFLLACGHCTALSTYH